MYNDLSIKNDTNSISGGIILKVIPSKEKIPVPGNILSLNVDSNHFTEILEEAELSDTMVILLGKKNQYSSDFSSESYYKYGCVAKVVQVIKMPAFGNKALVRCLKRVKITDFQKRNLTLYARIEPVELDIETDEMSKASLRVLKKLYKEYLEINPQLEKPDFYLNDDEFINPLGFIDLILGNLNLNYRRKQKMLEIAELKTLIRELHIVLINEIEFSKLEKKIEADV